MTDRPVSKTLRKLMPDALVGVGVFAGTLMLTFGCASQAAPYSPDLALLGPFVPGAGSPRGGFLLLAAAFAVIVTLDLAFLRHVLRTYSSPRGRLRRRQGRNIAVLPSDTEV